MAACAPPDSGPADLASVRADVEALFWTDLEVLPLSDDLAIASFVFRDSILTDDGRLLRRRGPTTLLSERPDGERRMRFGDADDYPISPASAADQQRSSGAQ